MDIKQHAQSALRARLLRVFPMVPGYDEPCSKPRTYLVFGATPDIDAFSKLVKQTWPNRHTVFLI